MKAPEERDVAHAGSASCSFRADAITESAEFRRLYDALKNVVHAEDMPFERSPDGLLKHLCHEKLNTRECCIEAYMQFLPGGGKSGNRGGWAIDFSPGRFGICHRWSEAVRVYLVA